LQFHNFLKEVVFRRQFFKKSEPAIILLYNEKYSHMNTIFYQALTKIMHIDVGDSAKCSTNAKFKSHTNREMKYTFSGVKNAKAI